MPLASNVTMTFTRYEVLDGLIRLWFVCAAPGPGEPSDYSVDVSDAEVGGVSNLTQFGSLVLGKLQRKFRAANIAAKLDPYLGRTQVI